MQFKLSLDFLLLISRAGGIIMGLVVGIFLIFAIMALIGILPKELAGTFELPIILHHADQFYEVEDLHAIYQSTEIEVKKANLEVLPRDSNLAQALLFIIAAIYGVFNYLILLNLSHLLESFKTPAPFKRNNSRYIQIIGLLTIAFPLYKYLIEILVTSVFHKHFLLQNATIPTFPSIWNINFSMLFLGFIILILAEVFKVGADLQDLEEQTV